MRIVFVHGMRQEGRDPNALHQVWRDALQLSWRAVFGSELPHETELPFYGDELHRLTEEVRGGTRPVTAKGAGDAGEFQPLEEALLRAMADEARVTDAEIRQELGEEIVAKGPANWEWVQAIARVLEHRIPPFRKVGLSFVRQVDAYLTRPHIRRAVDQLVEPALAKSPNVVIAHSLGTVVTYRLLRKLGGAAKVKLLITLGSPLGINAVRDRIRPPAVAVPDGVDRWVNGTDERDYVALQAQLDTTTFCAGIENLADFHNSPKDAHAIVDYLSDQRVVRLIESVRD